ncbi:hypothetical protein HELRODRAFT_99365 [Helobdella robusta]|uniref:Cytochrome P450 n=1 Tax=Helobdella robusta TaxID=6412 RepID=T1G9S3_HELRO|nr:hypothetical protein HELRODRAFT_99365 [Helobdella robusta]ESO05035.1 hypothetical protein HELRODRAFT_99365 [Helobdella robusta]
MLAITGFVFAASAIIWLWNYAKKPYSTLSKYKNIPVPKGGRYLFGHIFESAKHEHISRYELHLFSELGPTFGIVEFDTAVIITKDLDLIKEVYFNSSKTFSGRRKLFLRKWMRYSLVDQEGSEWKRIRNLLTPFFSTSKLKNNLSLVNCCCKTFIGHLEKMSYQQGPIDVLSLSAAFTLDFICSSAFGLQVDSQRDGDAGENGTLLTTLRKLTNLNFDDPLVFICFTFPFMSPILEFFGVSMFPSGFLEYFETFVDQIIRERLNSKDKQVNMHIYHIYSVGLTREEILAQTLIFVLAGYDTTSRTLTFALYSLAINPEVQEKVYKEIEDTIGEQESASNEKLSNLTYMDMFLNETMRCYPAAFRIDRRLTSNIQMSDGTALKKGTSIVVPIWAIHNDPQIYPDPEIFDPERFSPEESSKRNPLYHIPFGIGARNCIGMRMAQMVIKMALVDVLKNFVLLRIDETTVPLKMKKFTAFLQPESNIYLGLRRRTS